MRTSPVSWQFKAQLTKFPWCSRLKGNTAQHLSACIWNELTKLRLLDDAVDQCNTDGSNDRGQDCTGKLRWCHRRKRDRQKDKRSAPDNPDTTRRSTNRLVPLERLEETRREVLRRSGNLRLNGETRQTSARALCYATPKPQSWPATTKVAYL